MRVQLIVSKDIEEPYAEIHTNALTENIQKVMALLENENLEEVMENKSILAVKKDKDIVFLILRTFL